MKHEVEAVFLFIAELTGSFEAGSGTMETKIQCGATDYTQNHFPEVDTSTEEGRKDVHEVLWLERLYKELDEYFCLPYANVLMRTLALDTGKYRDDSYQWTVPIECDASASMIQYEGVLLGDVRMMEMTNVIGTTLEDPWKLEGMPRAMLKKAATPMLTYSI